jgi:hypothetical protein
VIDVDEVNRLGGCQGCQRTCHADHRDRGWRKAPGGMEQDSGMACKSCSNQLKKEKKAEKRKRKASDGGEGGDVKRPSRCDVDLFWINQLLLLGASSTGLLGPIPSDALAASTRPSTTRRPCDRTVRSMTTMLRRARRRLKALM